MSEAKPSLKNYRGQELNKDELINRIMQLQHLGQTQGVDIDWASAIDDLIDNHPSDWLDEEMTQIEELIEEDL